jgi:hypothetical protein
MCAAREEIYAQTLEKQSDLVEFREEKETVGKRFRKVRQFCAGTATVFSRNLYDRVRL